MKQVVIVVLLIVGVIPALAKPRTKTYSANCDRVWAAVKRATAPPHYNFAQLDDAQKKGLVSTGDFWTGKRFLDIALSGDGDTCKLAVGGNFSGLAHDDKGDLFLRIEGFLNPTGTVRVATDPPGAQIFIDNRLRSDKTPATFSLPTGKYVLAVVKDGRRVVRDVEVEDGVLANFELDLAP